MAAPGLEVWRAQIIKLLYHLVLSSKMIVVYIIEIS